MKLYSSIAPGSLELECCFLNAPQSSIHLRGAIAALSSSKSLMSDMGKLGRKSMLSRHIRWSAATQTSLFRVLGWRALQVLQDFIDLSNKNFQCRHTLRSAGRMEKHADTNLHIQTNVCERQRGHLSHRHWKLFVRIRLLFKLPPSPSRCTTTTRTRRQVVTKGIPVTYEVTGM